MKRLIKWLFVVLVIAIAAVEAGKDVVLLIDSLTRLARAVWDRFLHVLALSPIYWCVAWGIIGLGWCFGWIRVCVP